MQEDLKKIQCAFGAPTLHIIQRVMSQAMHITCHAMWERPRLELPVTCVTVTLWLN